MLQKRILLALFLLTVAVQGQTFVKANMATALVLIPNIGVETAISKKFTLQVDVTASFWKSVNNAPFQFVILTPEIRYHFKENANGFYVGGHIGGTAYKFQKWNYVDTNYYQKGFGYLIGATVGYQREISKKMAIDAFVGGGNEQGFYKGYYLDSGIRYDSAKKFNKSGEWFPYRGGIMLCYKID